jgi:D-methionine transport system ATP-binding protein
MIHIKNLHKTYATPHGRFEALRGITLHIAQGEVFGIIGPSGAGKSTLVQCINLLERPDEGTNAIGSQSLTGVPSTATSPCRWKSRGYRAPTSRCAWSGC